MASQAYLDRGNRHRVVGYKGIYVPRPELQESDRDIALNVDISVTSYVNGLAHRRTQGFTMGQVYTQGWIQEFSKMGPMEGV